jgi:histidinol-phosphate aminotransferase
MYRMAARAHGLEPVEVPLDATWDLDVGAVRHVIETTRPNLVFVASPNNPTSNALTKERLDAIAEAARAQGALFVLDQAYADYADAGGREQLSAVRTPGTAILRTVSKIGLAGLRVGWLEADVELVHELDKVRAPYNLSATSQAAARAVFDEAWSSVRALVAHVVSERARVTNEVGRFARGVAVAVPSAANFLWLRTEKPARDVHEALLDRGVLVRIFPSSGGAHRERMANMLRVTIGAPADNDAFLEALRACV